jgi:hypothetical protein
MASDDLEARLAALEDRMAIMELEAAYARTFDSRMGEEWAALFTGDGVYQSRGATRQGGGTFVRGRGELARFCSDAPFDGIHLMHLPQITVIGDAAESRVHLEFVSAFHEGDAPVGRMVGFYDVAYARIGGRWLIERRVTTTFSRRQASTFGYPAVSALGED